MAPVVLVTGCTTGGIGFSLCEEFAEQGCKVYASSRRIESIGDFKHPGVEKVALNVNSDDDIRQVIDQIEAAEGKIDVVVNNAGVICGGPLIDVEIDRVKDVFDTNVFSILRVSRAVIPVMAKRRSGTIINVGSVVGEVPTPWNGIYCATKAAVHSLSQVLFMECKPFNISVMHVAPGAVKSNIASNGGEGFRLPGDTLYSAFIPNILARINASQGGGSMPSEDFAKQVVSKALRRNPPRYMMLGGHSTAFMIFKWLPRGLVLFLMWRRHTKGH